MVTHNYVKQSKESARGAALMHTLIGLLFYHVICVVTDYVYFSSYTICRTLGSILVVQKQT